MNSIVRSSLSPREPKFLLSHLYMFRLPSGSFGQIYLFKSSRRPCPPWYFAQIILIILLTNTNTKRGVVYPLTWQGTSLAHIPQLPVFVSTLVGTHLKPAQTAQSFKYLGYKSTADGDTTEAIVDRMQAAAFRYSSLGHIWKSKKIGQTLKLL